MTASPPGTRRQPLITPPHTRASSARSPTSDKAVWTSGRPWWAKSITEARPSAVGRSDAGEQDRLFTEFAHARIVWWTQQTAEVDIQNAGIREFGVFKMLEWRARPCLGYALGKAQAGVELVQQPGGGLQIGGHDRKRYDG